MESHAAARDHRGRFEEPLHTKGERGLAATALAGEPEDLAALQLESDVLHRLHGRIDVVDDREVAHGEQGV